MSRYNSKVNGPHTNIPAALKKAICPVPYDDEPGLFNNAFHSQNILYESTLCYSRPPSYKSAGILRVS